MRGELALPAGAEAACTSVEPTALAAFAAELATRKESDWAWDNLTITIGRLASLCGGSRVIEIGGGRDPLLTPEEARRLRLDITVNDVSADELRHSPPEFATLRFDAAGDLAAENVPRGAFDLAFSRMVFEHVRDGRRAWTNLHALLAPGGIGLAFIPTLYALPYVVNKVVPERLSQAIVRALYPHRTDHEDPKFPAFYDLCVARSRVLRPVLEAIGFREVHVVPFYGHGYFDRIPVVREIDRTFNRLAAQNDWSFWASYAYVIARK